MADVQKLLSWYAKLKSRTVDLVGDYAGDELFIIEGDSLLYKVFLDKKLDFNPGFQMLHATYLVEQFLRALHQRGCKFHLVFFQEHAPLCIPLPSHHKSKAKYLLAREAIVQHLGNNLKASASPIAINVFESYKTPVFKDYLRESGAYFIMCHDGSFPRVEPEIDSVSISEGEEDGICEEYDGHAEQVNVSVQFTANTLGFRSMINWFISQRYNIALIDGLECRDTKVMAMIVEGTVQEAQSVLLFAEDGERVVNDGCSLGSTLISKDAEGLKQKLQLSLDTNNRTLESDSQKSHALEGFMNALENSQYPDLRQRDHAVVLALSLMLKFKFWNIMNTVEPRAMLLHLALLNECPLSCRAVSQGNTRNSPFLQEVVENLILVITSDAWKANEACQLMPCDLGDLIDGRIFQYLLDEKFGSRFTFPPAVIPRFNNLIALLELVCNVSLQVKQPLPTTENASEWGMSKISTVKEQKFQDVLFFKHPVFDMHLTPVRLTIDESRSVYIEPETSVIFQELSHWHNHRRSVSGKAVKKLSARQAFWVNRRNQSFMAEMRDYAASLTNSVGGVLQPETVFVKSSKENSSRCSNVVEPPHSKNKEIKYSTNVGKVGRRSKPSIKDIVAAEKERKGKEAKAQQLESWERVRASLGKERDIVTRFAKAKEYWVNRPSEKRMLVEAEILNYLLNILLEYWIIKCHAGEQDRHLHIAALIWDMIGRITKLKGNLTVDIVASVSKTTKALGLPDVKFNNEYDLQVPAQNTQITSIEIWKRATVDIGMTSTEFQLLHAGPFFDRNMGSAPDPRVRDFEPDEWQRAVLDEIDAEKSLFVVAPTSAGKTFISFYAMKKVLERNDDGVLVYVAPTKALVNQIAAEVQARFSKSFKHGGKSVWAIHTRDYRVNNPTGCQILVTVPHILQIMLLAPANANSWSSRVKRIIFDEIHCIGQAEDGVIWEQLLLLAPCPIIALSATVGNPKEFSKWLGMTQKTNGIDLEVIEHRHRYSDLRKYIYKPPQKFGFNGLPEPVAFAATGLDDTVGLTFMHPMVAVERSRKLPDDLDLEPRDCLTLWKAMVKYQTAGFPVEKSLDPSVCLPNIIRKVDVVKWESKLKSVVKNWIENPKSPFVKVLAELQAPIRSSHRPELQISTGKSKDSDILEDIANDPVSTALPLLCSLHEQGGLPAIFFNYDRTRCEKICEHVLRKLEEGEDRWKKSSPVWKAKVARWEAWKVSEENQIKKKAPSRSKKSNTKGDDGEDDISAKDRMREEASLESSIYETFDPQAPIDGYHFANVKKLATSDFESYATELSKRNVGPRLIAALRRGIGIHHAGMNRKYRQVCEILFRKGFLRVVIATGTLALGINMPCRTTVFAGDSIFLTALNFRQAAGRAGRRGFDLLGNVIFQNVSYPKVCRLLSSKLPDLRGHFPITTSLVLRLFALLHESKQSRNAVKMVNSLLSCPRIYLGGGEARDTVLHHLRFSIEYLRRNCLLGPTGDPLNFAGCVSHLYYVENSGFAFHALLKAGYFHRLCGRIGHQPKRVVLDLMLVLSHLFGRRYLRASVLENLRFGKRSSSKIVLPKLPRRAAEILRQHNEETLGIFSSYVKTFVDEHITEPDCNLPLTGVKCGGDQSFQIPGHGSRQPVRYTSAFHALSGHRDNWEDIPTLCDTVRCGVWLERAVVPYVGLDSEAGSLPLNAYLYDFFKHGDVRTLERDNEIRRNDIWFLLNDFSLILATIVTSFENFLRLSQDAGIPDATGVGDAQEDELEKSAIHDDELDNMSINNQPSMGQPDADSAPSAAAVVRPKKKKVEKVVENWDDDSDNDDEVTVAQEASSKKPPVAKCETPPPAWAGKDYGILNVLDGFKMLRSEFDQKFKEMWA